MAQDDSVSKWKHPHFDPTISLGHIITTVTMAVGMIWWAASVETRMSNHDIRFLQLERTDVEQERVRERQRGDQQRELKEIKEELVEIRRVLLSMAAMGKKP